MCITAVDELEEAGFQVLEAANADVALMVLEARSDEMQVLFTDVNMPGSLGDSGAGPPAVAAHPAADLLGLCPPAS